MAIETRCSCGRALVLRDELAGRVVRCPACGGRFEVPRVVEVTEFVEESVLPQLKTKDSPPPLSGEVDEEFVEVAGVEVRPGPPPVPKPAYAAEPPPPVGRRFGKPKRKRRKKQSIYNEFYGDEPGHHSYASDWMGSGLTAVFGLLFVFLMVILLWAVGIIWIGGIVLLALVVLGVVIGMVNGSGEE